MRLFEMLAKKWIILIYPSSFPNIFPHFLRLVYDTLQIHTVFALRALQMDPDQRSHRVFYTTFVRLIYLLGAWSDGRSGVQENVWITTQNLKLRNYSFRNGGL